MDKSCHESKDNGGGDDSTTSTNTCATTSTTKDEYLRHLNKISHKISKQPPLFKKPPPPSLAPSNNQQFLQQQQQQLQQNQPPVYNINKSDFRDVVQKLTGSPVHHLGRFNTPTPIQPPKPPSSRLHRIRPPPLAHLSNRPPDLLTCAVPLQIVQRSLTPLSPLPAFPSVHLAAESPVSAYLRSISAVDSDPSRFSGFSPPIQPPSFQIPAPMSPIPFGRLPSPRSGSLCSPNGGQLGFGSVSPKVPVDSPRWRDVV